MLHLACAVARFAVLVLVVLWPIYLQAQSAPLGDAKAIIAEQQARLGSSPGIIVLDRPARLDGDVTLAEGHDLRIAAPLRVEHATVHLSGHNEVRCDAPVAVENATDLFAADGATDLSVRDCDVTVEGQPGGYLLTATRSARVVASGNHLVNMAIFNTRNAGGPTYQTTDVTITNNSTEMHNARLIGVYLMYVLRAVVANNRFMGTGHGVEWWGGDGNLGWHGAEAVTLAGFLSISGNECFDPGGACVWGSMGEDVAVTGNTAVNCGDVCFDTEGGVRNLFSGNVAHGCGSGCYSVQMESVDAVFTGNFAYADAKAPTTALVLIKHHSGNPAPHANLTITGNTLSCGAPCTAFYTEGEDGLDFSRNTITNGTVVFANYTNSVRVVGNDLRFTLPLGGAAISAPALFNGHASLVQGNTLLFEGPPSPRSACIVEAWTDFNDTDEMRITDNTCIGFATGIVTETAGKNPGAPQAIWLLKGNQFSRVPDGRQLVHLKTSGNESYTAP